MTTLSGNTKPENVCTRFSRLDLDPESVRSFIDWLCGTEPVSSREEAEAKFDPLESMWGWNAPRHRTAKLLWQFVHGNTDEA